MNRAWLAYHTAALGRIAKMPKLKAIMPKPRGNAAANMPTPWEKQLAIAHQWAAAFAARPT